MGMFSRTSSKPESGSGAAASGGRRAEFEQAAMEQLAPLYRTALRLTKNERDAEDLVQDALLSAFRSFDQFEKGTQFRAWLFKILTNTFINKYRRRVLEQTVAQSLKLEGDVTLMSAGGVRAARDAEEALGYALLGDAIQRALGELPEEFRMAVVLCDVEEFSYREIADIMDCPVGTVMSRLHRGRRLLQVTLREHAERAGILSDRKRVDAGRAEASKNKDAESSKGGVVIPLRARVGRG